MAHRRAVLGAGAGALLAGGAALGWRAWHQGVFSTGEGPAYEAWKQWDAGPPGSPQRLLRARVELRRVQGKVRADRAE